MDCKTFSSTFYPDESLVLNIAHRGARSIAPENTLLAARKGLEAGADLWETDLAVTRDEQLILCHDPSLRRTTDVGLKFPERAQESPARFTLAEIRTLDAGSWFVETDPFGRIAAGALSPAEQGACRGEKVPTLEEALVWTRDVDWVVNLELKRLPTSMAGFPLVDRVLSIIDRVGIAPERVRLSSFYHPWLKEVLSLRPDVSVQALIGEKAYLALDWGFLEFATYNVRHTLVSDEEIRRRKAQGLVINLFTVNDAADMRRYRRLGVDGIFTDFPQRLAHLH
jgi:glycerophosphoryl diester phosphodiesterase